MKSSWVCFLFGTVIAGGVDVCLGQGWYEAAAFLGLMSIAWFLKMAAAEIRGE